MEPPQKYETSTWAIDLDTNSRLSAPFAPNYAAKIITVSIYYVERIPTVKDLIFKLNRGFLVNNKWPSGSASSRLLFKLSESNILEPVREKVVLQAVGERFIIDDTIAIDTTHFEARGETPSPKQHLKDIGANPIWNRSECSYLWKENRIPIRYFIKCAPYSNSTCPKLGHVE